MFAGREVSQVEEAIGKAAESAVLVFTRQLLRGAPLGRISGGGRAAAAPGSALPAATVAAVAGAPLSADPADADAVPFGSDRPYGTPVPGGILIGADISMQLKARIAPAPIMTFFCRCTFLLCGLLGTYDGPPSVWKVSCEDVLGSWQAA